MRRLGGYCSFMCLVLAFFGCGKADTNQAQNQPPAAQQPATQAQPPQQAAAPQTPAQAQPPEAVPQPTARPSQVTGQKAAQPRPASPAPATQAPSPAAQPPAAPATGGTETRPSVPATPPARQPDEVPVTPLKAPPAPPPPLVVASGSRLEIRLVDAIGSETSKAGDTFRATLDQNLEVDGTVVAPRGSLLKGKVLEAKPSGRVEGRAAMSVTLTGIEVGKTTYAIQTNTLAFQAESTTKGDALKIGIGAAVGAAIGAIAGGGKGAAIGAAVGGGAGTATVLVTKGKEVKFPAEERFSFVLQSNLEIRR